ncbi:GNAT family N-acetyltransferase [Rhodobacteraceae bacterium CCMM004]|nr:GNAT family N-acetyltransferase [Rhodobacteraceae bacterium CCMM004]
MDVSRTRRLPGAFPRLCARLRRRRLAAGHPRTGRGRRRPVDRPRIGARRGGPGRDRREVCAQQPTGRRLCRLRRHGRLSPRGAALVSAADGRRAGASGQGRRSRADAARSGQVRCRGRRGLSRSDHGAEPRALCKTGLRHAGHDPRRGLSADPPDGSAPAMPGMITLRPYTGSDADALVAIYRKSVRRLGPRAYRPDQVAAWLSVAPDRTEMHRLYTDGRHAIVAVDPNGAPVGFSDLAGNGHIRFLYVDPDHVGRGVGRAMVAALLDHARTLAVVSVFSDASDLARPLFERAGFTCIARQEHRIAGIRIHNHHMSASVPCSGTP